MAGLVGGVNRTLDIESLRQLDGIADFGGNYCSQDVINCGETSLHCCRKMAREKEAEWEIMFACDALGTVRCENLDRELTSSQSCWTL
jgi:hypothetical protein